MRKRTRTDLCGEISDGRPYRDSLNSISGLCLTRFELRRRRRGRCTIRRQTVNLVCKRLGVTRESYNQTSEEFTWCAVAEQ
jgi:hypothetical protein